SRGQRRRSKPSEANRRARAHPNDANAPIEPQQRKTRNAHTVLRISTAERRELAQIRTRLFFFQAEDGIRDLTVTGDQTCALPIWFTVKLLKRILSKITSFIVIYHYPCQICTERLIITLEEFIKSSFIASVKVF